MAEETTSGNIYNLKTSTIDRISKIGDAEATQFEEGRVQLTDIGETISEKATNIGKAKDFNDNVNSILERGGTLFTDQNHGELRGILEGMKSENLDGLLNGDKAVIQDTENSLNSIQRDVIGWDELGSEVASINSSDGIGWSASMSEEERRVISEVSGDKARMGLNENGEVVFNITAEDGSDLSLTRTEFDNLVTENLPPSEFIKEGTERALQMLEAGGIEGASFDPEAIAQENLSRVSAPGAPRISSLLRDKNIVPNTNQSIKDMLRDLPSIKSWNFQVEEGNPLDVNADGFITAADFEASDYENLVQMLEQPEYAEMARGLVAEAMTLQDERNFNKSRATATDQPFALVPGSATQENVNSELSTQGVTAADLIASVTTGTTTPEATTPGAITPGATATGTEGEGRVVTRQYKTTKPLEKVLSEMTNIIYHGKDVQRLKKQFQRQARSMGMGEVDIDNLFSSGGAIITKSPDGKYTVRLRTDDDKNLPKQDPSGKAV